MPKMCQGKLSKDMKSILLLIGQKGSGKSYIGEYLEKEFGIKFIRVEDWAKSIKKGRSVNNEEYLNEVFFKIKNGIREKISKCELLSFESLGLTKQFDQMLQDLKKEYNLVTVKINCDFNRCIERIKFRDQSIHIEFSEEQLKKINSAFLEKGIKTDFEVNNNDNDINKLRKDLEKIINNIHIRVFGT